MRNQKWALQLTLKSKDINLRVEAFNLIRHKKLVNKSDLLNTTTNNQQSTSTKA